MDGVFVEHPWILWTSPSLLKATNFKEKKNCSGHFGGCNKMHSPGTWFLFQLHRRRQSCRVGAHVSASLWGTSFISLQSNWFMLRTASPWPWPTLVFTIQYPGLGRAAPPEGNPEYRSRIRERVCALEGVLWQSVLTKNKISVCVCVCVCVCVIS